MKSEFNKIKKLMSDDTWDALSAYDCIIAGGAITSVYTNREVNDIDVYFRCAEDFVGFVRAIYGSSINTYPSPSENKFEVGEFGFSLIICNVAEKSILCIDKRTRAKIQLICFDFFKTPQEIFDKFDFTVCMGALECKSERFNFHTDFFKHNAQRYLQFNPNTSYPIISMLRVQKYVSRGYSISKSQMLRIIFRINSLSLSSWKELREHCGGMYGVELNKIFPDEEEFSLDKAMEILENISAEANQDVFDVVDFNSNVDYEVLREKFIHIFQPIDKDTRETLPNNRYFKNVKKIGDGKYQSYFAPSFKYELNGIVNGGSHGIYCYSGRGVWNGQYTYGDSVIIELEPQEENHILQTYDSLGYIMPNTSKQIQLVGGVKVIAEYSRDEFVEKFR